MKKIACLSLLVVSISGEIVNPAYAQLSVVSTVGGVPTADPASLALYNFDTNTTATLSYNSYTLSDYAGSSATATLTLNSGSYLETGSISGQWAAPYFSGNTASVFGETPTSGQDASQYLAVQGGGTATLTFGSAEKYLGILWGSVDTYNTLSFYNGSTLIGSLTGSQIQSDASGDQGANGTYYVSINSTLAFNKIIATSSQNSFEFDDIAVSGSTQFTPSPTPEPSVTALGLASLLGLAAIRQYRRPQSQRIN